MKLPLIAVIILSISMTLAFEYGQTTWGNGELSSRVDIVGAKEAVQAEGEHEHIIYIENAKENSRLDSIYRLNALNDEDTVNATNKTLKKYGDIAPNTYMFSLNRIDSIWHQAEVHSIGNISSTSTAIYGPAGASTDLDVSAQEGSIEERVESYWDYRMGLPIHGHPIVQTFTNGSMGIRSHLKDDTVLQYGMSDADILRDALESVDLYGEIARQELNVNRTEFSVQGEDESYTLNDYTSVSDLTRNMSKIKAKEESMPKILRESLAQLGITDVKGTAEESGDGPIQDSEKVSNNEVVVSEEDVINVWEGSEPEDLLGIKAALDPLNSTAMGNNDSINSSNNILNDFNGPAEAEEVPGDGGILDNDTEVVISTDDVINVWEANDTLAAILFPPVSKERATFKLGDDLQRLGTAHVGRKVRRDHYFSETQVPLSNATLSHANTTRAIALTDSARMM